MINSTIAHLIDKDAVVAEIEKYISNYKVILNKVDKSSDDWLDSTLMLESKIGALQHILSFINTLEVEEVDLDEEIEKCLKRHNMLAVGKKDFTDIAKHFYSLGMAASNKAQKG